MSQNRAPSRRSFLVSTAVAAAAVAGGGPVLSGCSSGESGSKEGTTSGEDLKKILPTFVASRVFEPDIAGKNGSAVGFTTVPAPGDLKTSVPEKLGKGGSYTVMAPFWGTPPADDCAYYKAMNKAIGVEVGWQNQDGNTYDEKLGAVLASSDVPDVVVIPGWELGGKIPSAIRNKFADLGPFLSGDKVKDYPNLAAIPTAAWQRSVFGGALRGIPMPASDIPNIVPFYRADLFEENGYTVPTSTDSFLALAKEATAPKSKVWACDDMKWSAFNFFGVLSGEENSLGWKRVDGKLVYRVETEEYLEALEWTRKLFAAGVVHPDAKAAQGDAGNRFTAGQVLMYNQDLSHWYVKTIEQEAQNPDFRIKGMDLFNHDGGDPVLYAGNPADIWAFVSKKASEKQIRDILAIANFTAAPYGTKERRMRQYGVEGTHYTMKDGVPVKTEKGNTEVIGTYEFMGTAAPFIAYPDHPEIVKQVAGWQQRMGAFVTRTPFYGMQISEPNRFAGLSDKFEDLEDSITRGRKKVSDMEKAVEEWRRRGGDKLRDWYQELLDKNGGEAS